MRIAEVRRYRYRLPLTAPLSLKGETVHVRGGLLVAIEGEDGTTGWGDVAPLPGFSEESLSEAAAQLDALGSLLVGQSVKGVQADRPWAGAPASVCYGIELALMHLQAEERGVILPETWADEPRATVSLNALVSGSPDEVMQEAERIRTAGYRALKLKVGRRDLQAEAALARQLVEQFGAGMQIRLDANRAWTFDEAQRFFEAVDPSAIDYVEEPLADPSELPALADGGVPVALDETARDLTVDALGRHRYAQAIILKPSLVGGLEHTLRMAGRATEFGVKPVISAAYESGVGLRGLVALAAGLGPMDIPAGLDTYRRLRADVLDPRLPLERPVLDVSALMRAPLRLNVDTVTSINQPTADG